MLNKVTTSTWPSGQYWQSLALEFFDKDDLKVNFLKLNTYLILSVLWYEPKNGIGAQAWSSSQPTSPQGSSLVQQPSPPLQVFDNHLQVFPQKTRRDNVTPAGRTTEWVTERFAEKTSERTAERIVKWIVERTV